MARGSQSASLGVGEGGGQAGVGGPWVFPSIGFSGLGVGGRRWWKIKGQKAEVMEGRTCSLQG